MKQIIVSGSTCMIGRALIDICLANDIKVIALVRNMQKAATLPKSNLLVVKLCDLRDMSCFYEDEAHNSDVFYHFAWAHTDREGRSDAIKQNTNISFALDAVNLAHRHGCKTVVGAGSQAEYGRWELNINTDDPVTPCTAYGIAKYAAGQLSTILAEQLGISYIHARIFSVYGPYNESDTMVMSCIKTLLQGNKPSLTQGEQEWDYLYSKDAAQALFLLGNISNKSSIYNIASGKTQQLKNYFNYIRNAINPALSLGIGEKEYPTGKVQNLGADISNLTKETGFVPKYTFDKGIKETIEWVKNSKL